MCHNAKYLESTFCLWVRGEMHSCNLTAILTVSTVSCVPIVAFSRIWSVGSVSG